MPLWVAISLGAAFLQNLRTALQKALTPRVGVLGATYARFLFAAPWAVLLVAVLMLREGAGLPRLGRAFAVWGLVGAVAQIGATLLLLHLFSLRNFAVGNTFAKTETVQSVLFGFLLLGDRVGALALAGIAGQPRGARAAVGDARSRRRGAEPGGGDRPGLWRGVRGGGHRLPRRVAVAAGYRAGS